MMVGNIAYYSEIMQPVAKKTLSHIGLGVTKKPQNCFNVGNIPKSNRHKKADLQVPHYICNPKRILLPYKLRMRHGDFNFL